MAEKQGKSPLLRAVAGCVALTLLAIFLAAKVPSSKCHCQDPVKSKKEICPFGVLRSLSIVEPFAAVLIVRPRVALAATTLFSFHAPISVSVPVSHRSRSPPPALCFA